jgi:hypothetical protein
MQPALSSDVSEPVIPNALAAECSSPDAGNQNAARPGHRAIEPQFALTKVIPRLNQGEHNEAN